MRDHIDQLCRQTGKTPEELGLVDQMDEDEPEIPFAGEGIWGWFQELCQGRSQTEFGPAPLAWQDMDAWTRLFGMDLTPYEISVLKSMDMAYMAARAEATKKQASRKQRQTNGK